MTRRTWTFCALAMGFLLGGCPDDGDSEVHRHDAGLDASGGGTDAGTCESLALAFDRALPGLVTDRAACDAS